MEIPHASLNIAFDLFYPNWGQIEIMTFKEKYTKKLIYFANGCEAPKYPLTPQKVDNFKRKASNQLNELVSLGYLEVVKASVKLTNKAWQDVSVFPERAATPFCREKYRH